MDICSEPFWNGVPWRCRNGQSPLGQPKPTTHAHLCYSSGRRVAYMPDRVLFADSRHRLDVAALRFHRMHRLERVFLTLSCLAVVWTIASHARSSECRFPGNGMDNIKLFILAVSRVLIGLLISTSGPMTDLVDYAGVSEQTQSCMRMAGMSRDLSSSSPVQGHEDNAGRTE